MKPTMYVEKRSDLTLLKKAFELTDATCHRTRLKCGCKAYKRCRQQSRQPIDRQI